MALAAIASIHLVITDYVFDPSPVPNTQTNGASEVLIKTLQNSSLQFRISLGTKHPISTEKLKATCTNPAECIPTRQQWDFSSYSVFFSLRAFLYTVYGNLSSQCQINTRQKHSGTSVRK